MMKRRCFPKRAAAFLPAAGIDPMELAGIPGVDALKQGEVIGRGQRSSRRNPFARLQLDPFQGASARDEQRIVCHRAHESGEWRTAAALTPVPGGVLLPDLGRGALCSW